MVIKIDRIAHIVLYVRDPDSSADWYCRNLGMQVVTRVQSGPYAGGCFLSFGRSDHDIALFPRKNGASAGTEFEHVGLQLDCNGDLDELRRCYGTFLKNGVRIAEVLDHGVSVGIYFYDPDGHMLEVFVEMVSPEQGALAELARNGGQADPIQLEPLYD